MSHGGFGPRRTIRQLQGRCGTGCIAGCCGALLQFQQSSAPMLLAHPVQTAPEGPSMLGGSTQTGCPLGDRDDFLRG